jgi:Zn finger protein HypA/HybF involved in hydrogenase expression
MKYKCPECGSEDLTEIVEYIIRFDLKTGKELSRDAADIPPKYECRNCKEFLPYNKLSREYENEK